MSISRTSSGKSVEIAPKEATSVRVAAGAVAIRALDAAASAMHVNCNNYIAVQIKKSMAKDFESILNLQNSVAKQELLRMLLAQTEGEVREKIGRYALACVYEEKPGSEMRAYYLINLLSSVESLVPEITREIRQIVAAGTLSENDKVKCHDALLTYGDRKQLDEIVHEAFAFIQQMDHPSAYMLTTLLETTTNQTQQEVLVFAWSHIEKVLNPIEVVEAFAKIPPKQEHLRKNILSKLLQLDGTVNTLEKQVLVWTAYLQLANLEEYKEKIQKIDTLILQFEGEFTSHLCLVRLFIELLKKTDDVTIFEKAFQLVQRMENPLPQAELMESLLKCCQRLKIEQRHSRLIQYATELLQDRKTTSDAKTILYQAIFDHSQVTEEMEDAIFGHIKRNKPEKNVNAALLLTKLVQTASQNQAAAIMRYAATLIGLMSGGPQRSALLLAILERMSTDRTLVSEEKNLLNLLFAHLTVERLNLLKLYAPILQGTTGEAFEQRITLAERALGQGRSSAAAGDTFVRV